MLNIGDPIWSSEFGYGSANALHAVSDEEYISGETSLYVNEKRTYRMKLPKGVNVGSNKVKWVMYKSVGGPVVAKVNVAKGKTKVTVKDLSAKKKVIVNNEVKAKGTYYVEIVGNGNYKDSVSKAFKVV